MAKVVTHLCGQEMNAWNDLAQDEYRPVKAQAAMSTRTEMKRPGMTTVPSTNNPGSIHLVSRTKLAGKPGGAA
jgi:hypothetical protein